MRWAFVFLTAKRAEEKRAEGAKGCVMLVLMIERGTPGNDIRAESPQEFYALASFEEVRAMERDGEN